MAGIGHADATGEIQIAASIDVHKVRAFPVVNQDVKDTCPNR
jgi:hypothetical protein